MNPAPIPYTKIVEAYGLRKCPKLVEQITDESLDVRINALSVLCDEFNNPYSIHGCVQAGAISVLADMIVDSDYTTRDKASLALSIAARDANGLTAILEFEVIPNILEGINDPTSKVRGQVYECLYQITRTTDGILASVSAGVTVALVKIVLEEDDILQPLILRSIYNICKDHQGLLDALTSGAVPTCINLLSDPKNTQEEVIVDAARTLGFICFADEAKDEAIEAGAVPTLVELLKIQTTVVRSATTLALMAITSTDEGKRQMLPSGAVPMLIDLLRDSDRTVKANTLKIVSNTAVSPEARTLLRTDPDCMSILKEMASDSCADKFLCKHAKAALAAVMWKA
eukprot:CAMPEP_0182416594 /NCGR_PEP_ID=MMETSP1167-20130531/955_1 /TAXON_ID=2988 /ORGANISM="Mallomonas Sp, Strain CCMP3275" /LENGTH=342 /DNA_ID=CAMNT_0024589527 /DNA_START=113 /DNA_END=1144 /DNA_ORIENTATION=-